MNNKMKVVSGIMVAAMATLTVNLIGSKDVHANHGGGLDRGESPFGDGVVIPDDGEIMSIEETADFNQDSFDDVIASVYSLSLGTVDRWIYLNDKNGGFIKTWQLPCNDVMHKPVIGDMNGDGYPDMLCRIYPDGLLLYINQLGPGLACNTDLNDDGTVNITDLLVLIADWGDCS